MESKENNAVPTWTTLITVDGGTNAAEEYLSCQANGTVDLYDRIGKKGRQKWVFHQLQKNVFNILVAGGTDKGKTFLSSSSDGGLVDLYDSDDGSGRQRWTLHKVASDIHKVASDIYNIKIFSGTKERVFLSCKEGGYVDLWYRDDASGRQRWKLEVPLVNVDFVIDKGKNKAKILSSTPEVLAEQEIMNSSSRAQSQSFQVEERVEETSSFERGSSVVSMKIGTKFEAGVPFVSNGKIHVEHTTHTQTWGETTSISKTVRVKVPVVAPPWTKIVCSAKITKSKLKVPCHFTFADGTVENGMWEGVSAWGVTTLIEETSLGSVEEKKE